jgi:tripartite motif-containing protein 71
VLPSGDVFVGSGCVNPGQHMEHFTAAGVLVGTWGFPAGYLGTPIGVAADGSGNVYVADYDGSRVYKFTSSGALLTTWGSLGSAPGQFRAPVDIAVDGFGDVFVVEMDGKRVQKFTSGGSYLKTIGSAGTGQGQFQQPYGIAVDASGRLYVADVGRARVLCFLANGSFDMEFATLSAPSDVAVGPDRNVYVIRYDYDGLYQYSPSGALLWSFFSSGGLPGTVRIAINPAGTIFITEKYYHRITRFQIDQTTGVVRSTFGRLKALYR